MKDFSQKSILHFNLRIDLRYWLETAKIALGIVAKFRFSYLTNSSELMIFYSPWNYKMTKSSIGKLINSINLFVPNKPFFYPLKKTENRRERVDLEQMG